MADYISREAAMKACCDGCNSQFEDDPCEPSECIILHALRSIPAAFEDAQIAPCPILDVVPADKFRALVEKLKSMAEKEEYKRTAPSSWAMAFETAAAAIIEAGGGL